MRIIINLTEKGDRWLKEWYGSAEHEECRMLCGSYEEYICRTGIVLSPLGAQFGIESVVIEGGCGGPVEPPPQSEAARKANKAGEKLEGHVR